MKTLLVLSLLICVVILEVSSTPVPPQDTTTSPKVELEPEDDPARLKRYKELGLHETIVPRTQPYEALHPNKKPGVKLDSSVSLPSAHVRFVTESHIPFDPASNPAAATPPLNMVPSKGVTNYPQRNDPIPGNGAMNSVPIVQRQDQTVMTDQSVTPAAQKLPTALENTPTSLTSPPNMTSQMQDTVLGSGRQFNQEDGNVMQKIPTTETVQVQTTLHEVNENENQHRLNSVATSAMGPSAGTTEEVSMMKNMPVVDVMPNQALRQPQDAAGMGHMPMSVNGVPVDGTTVDSVAPMAPVITRTGTGVQN